jgi:hypothetical protein
MKKTSASSMETAIQAQKLQERLYRNILKRIAKLKSSEFRYAYRAALDMERRAGQAAAAEYTDPRRPVGAPHVFTIQFIGRPDGMITVRLADGQTGFIPVSSLESFKADYPDAVVLSSVPDC